jgi:uncharacterized protein DUF1566
VSMRRTLLVVALLCAAGCKPRVPLPVGALPRFSDLGDGTVRDNRSGSIWAKRPEPVPGRGAFGGFTWAEALAYVSDVNAGRRPNAGHDDWRLPAAEELVTLIRAFWVPGSTLACLVEDRDSGCRFRVGFAPFVDVVESGYWTGTTVATDRARDGYVPSADGASAESVPDAWMVDQAGVAFRVTKTARRSVWLVRGPPTRDVRDGR